MLTMIVIQSDTHWADTVDMDATDSTVIVTYNDDAELWKAGVWRFLIVTVSELFLLLLVSY